MSVLDESVAAAAGRNFYDDGKPEALVIDWTDPVERCAIALLLLRAATPEAVTGRLSAAAGRGLVEGTWQACDVPTRHLYRRRAALLLDLAQRAPKGA